LKWRREGLDGAKGHPKTGGRSKGGVDKIKREAILAAQGITPLDYMMMLVRAETEPGVDPAVAKARETLPLFQRVCME
jgi:hypothetical protein